MSGSDERPDRFLARWKSPSGASPSLTSEPRSGGPDLLRALFYMRPYKRDVAAASALLLLVSAASLMMPQLFRYAIDVGIGRREVEAITLAVAGILILAAGRAAFSFLQSYLAERVSQRVAEELRVALYTHIHQLNYTFTSRVHTGQLLTRLTSNVEQISGFVGGGAIRIIGAGLLFVGCMALLAETNWKLAVVTLATIPASFALLMRIGRRVGKLFGQIHRAVERLSEILQEDLAGMRTIRTFCREQYEADRFRAVNRTWLDRNIEFLRFYANNFPFALMFGNLATLTIIWYGGWETINGRLTLGELIAFCTYLGFLHYTTVLISFQTTYLLGARSASARVFEILDYPLDVCEAAGARPLPAISGRVEFRDVHFRYPGSERETLRGVSFCVSPGQTVALVGPTGSGKSTIAHLIPRLLDATSGAVLVEGQDVKDVTLESLRGQIGFVLQDTLLVSGSIGENIAFGKPGASQAEIETAARVARAHDFISKLPAGYDTNIGSAGASLSGGQRQRIAIARAVLINPRLLILDDSTSAVDSATEEEILESLDGLMRQEGRTVFVIAHRLNTVRDADLILVLDGGQIIATGTHETLLRECPLYYEIMGPQLEGRGVAA